MTDNTWPFGDSEDTAVITLGRILRGETSLLLVTHDEDDGSWQFLDGEHVLEEDAVVVGLAEMVQFDPSLLELADLPEGAYARRSAPGQSWIRGDGDPPVA
ncbi:MAG: hypothetical protein P4L84_31805 [Isosphaeraceae bacterium]|nr:hypothetical protein [Isosphaeraceae bacterium]